MTDKQKQVLFVMRDGRYLSAFERDAIAAVLAEVERLRTRLLSAAGDDLCRLTQDEIKSYTSGSVKIPPKEEFLASCERFHQQIAEEAGVLDGCLTLAQLVAENERLMRLLRDCEAQMAPQEVDRI